MLEVVAPRSRVMVRDTPARLGLGKANKSGFVEPRRTVKPVFLLPFKKKKNRYLPKRRGGEVGKISLLHITRYPEEEIRQNH